MSDLPASIDRLAESTAFSGAVRIDRGLEIVHARAYGYAHRALRQPNTIDTRFAVASGTKGLTALTVVSLIEEGLLDLSTPVRPLLGQDLELIGDDVTVEHLLSHRSGIGDYVDEDDPDLDPNDHVLAVPVHELATTEQYLRILDGYAPKFPAGTRFSYCNSGYVVLALIAERSSRTPFHELVHERVCRPAGMADTEFLRSDELPARTAVGYLTVDGPRSNVLHLPVRGSGDGGIYTTVADVHSLWEAFFAGRIVASNNVAEMVRPHSDASTSEPYGLGFWLGLDGDAVSLEGSDAGVSFRSTHRPSEGTTYTVVANTTGGAWPIARHLNELLGP